MKLKRALIYLFVGCAATAILRGNAAPAQPGPAEDVPMVRLVANPERYDGKRVHTFGFVRLEFEGDAIYPYEADYRHSMAMNGLWFDIDLEPKEAKKVNRMYCLVEGTFDAKDQGHMGMWSGAITKVTRLRVWSDPAHSGSIEGREAEISIPGAPPLPPPIAVKPRKRK